MKTDPNSNQKYLQIMQSELEHIQTIANNLLKYSRPQYDTYTKVNVVSVIKDVLFLLETEAFKNHLTIHFDAKQDFYFVIGDKPQLKQVLLNLVKNALDATPAGKEIFIRIVKGTKQVQIQIEDQGCGIPEEQMNKLGTSFYTTKEKGTGLGLMVSFNIIKNHKGQIFLKSKEGEGSTFTIALPIAVEK
jgi:signal transduction histidine kinase